MSLPAGFTTFPGEIFRAPRSWVEQAYPNLTYFNEVDKGGHFAAWEEPDLFATEVRAAFKPLRNESYREACRAHDRVMPVEVPTGPRNSRYAGAEDRLLGWITLPSSANVRPRYRRLGRSPGRSRVEIDVHSYVLTALDQHLRHCTPSGLN